MTVLRFFRFKKSESTSARLIAARLIHTMKNAIGLSKYLWQSKKQDRFKWTAKSFTLLRIFLICLDNISIFGLHIKIVLIVILIMVHFKLPKGFSIN